MPVERTRGSRRAESDGSALVWTHPVAPPPSDGSPIAFATNVTPTSFSPTSTDSPTYPWSAFAQRPSSPDPIVGFAHHDHTSFVAPPAARRTVQRKRNRAKDSAPTTPPTPTDGNTPATPHIPRPPNAFILFRSSFIRAALIPARVEPSHSTLSRIIGLTWQALPEAERSVWHAKARKAREEHAKRFPGYAFRPRRGNVDKGQGDGEGDEDDPGDTATHPTRPPRKQKITRTPLSPPSPARNAHIASLLLAGLAGADLNTAIAEYDARCAENGSKEGVEVRWEEGNVWTPEGRGVGGASVASPKEGGAKRRRKTSASAPSPAPVPAPTPAASAPLDLSTDMDTTNAFDWDAAFAFSPATSSPFSPFDSAPASPYLAYSPAASPNFDSSPPSPYLAHSPAYTSAYTTDESCPASPALSFSSATSYASSSSPGLSREPSFADLSSSYASSASSSSSSYSGLSREQSFADLLLASSNGAGAGCPCPDAACSGAFDHGAPSSFDSTPTAALGSPFAFDAYPLDFLTGSCTDMGMGAPPYSLDLGLTCDDPASFGFALDGMGGW